MSKFFNGATETEKRKDFDTLDSVFKRVKTLNNDLLRKSDLDEIHLSSTIDEAMDFYITSFSLSFLNNIYLQNRDSLGQLMNIRCIIEGMAMKMYCRKNTTEIDQNLFKFQSFILERNIYKMFPEFDQILFDMNQINSNFEETKKLYKIDLSISTKEFAKLSSLKVPFLNEKMSFSDLVESQLGPDVAMLYKQLSMLVHPHDYRFIQNCTYILEVSEEYVFNFIKEMYDPIMPNVKKGLNEEYDLLIGMNPVGYGLRELITQQKDLIYKVSRVCAQHGLAGLGVILMEYAPLLYDFTLDIIYGYTEHGTTKLKVLMELLGMLDRCKTDLDLRKGSALLEMHTNCMYLKNGKTDNHDLLAEANKLYISKFPNGVNESIFSDKFQNTLGFLINESGEVPSLNSLSMNVITEYSKYISNNRIPDGKGNEVSLELYMSMKLKESQIMSHASGYMFFTTTGAWVDGCNMLLFMDEYLKNIMKSFLEVYRLEDNRNKTIVNLIRNFLKDNESLLKNKHALLSLPKSQKNF